jgi:hypothetical protein
LASPEQQKRARVFRILTLVGLVLTTLSFFTPMWWVSLKAPNYPEHTFPQGVKIQLHWNGVRNGCRLQVREDIVEDFALSGIMLLAALFYSGPLWWFLFLPGILLPVGFLVDFAGWLWWFGHNLHDWSAFTVKPFMPTVLGEGKVAQFSTFAYPDYGFALVLVGSLSLALALLVRRKQLQPV